MRTKKKTQDFDISYAVTKIFVNLFFRQYYRKIHIEGLENIPKDKRVIVAPNHQNALMDALAILMTQKGQPVYLARADIFKNKRVAGILEWLNILPVYRMRDGRDELGKNEEIFDKAVDVLRDKVTLCLMPEGMQSFKRTLLPLVKGMFRIAFSAQSAFAPQEVVIVPVGIDYEDYIHYGGDMGIRFGKPIAVSDYMPLYAENQAVALNQIKQEVSDSINALIQNIRSKTYYDDFYSLSLMAQEAVCTKEKRQNRFFSLLEARRKITMALDSKETENPEFIRCLCSKHADYQKKLSSFRLKDFVLGRPQKLLWTLAKGFLLLLMLPLFLVGRTANFIPSFIPNFIAGRLKSDHFKSSFNVVLRLILYILYYLLAIIVLSIVFKSFLIVVLSCAASLILSRFCFFYRLWCVDFFHRIRFFIKKIKNPKEITLLEQQRRDIINEVMS